MITESDNANGAMSERTLKRVSVFLGLILMALLTAFCFVASVPCITVVVAAFLAILVDPLVVRLEKAYLGRSLAAGIVVVCGMVLIGFLAYSAYQKADAFANALPSYALQIRHALTPAISKFERFQRNAESINPSDGVPAMKIREAPDWPSFLFHGVGSISSGLIVAGVVPFLCFFMLVKKDHIWARFESMFDSRLDAPKFVRDLDRMVRGFVVGNLVVGFIMAGATSMILLILGMDNPFALGTAVAVLNLVPILGAAAACAVAFAAGLLQFTSLWPFVIIALTIVLLHVVAQNVLIPRIIGARVSVGPVSVLIGMLFWGWLWGVVGLLMAVPLTAFVKLIADTQPSLGHLSDILAESPPQKAHWQVHEQNIAREAEGPFHRLAAGSIVEARHSG